MTYARYHDSFVKDKRSFFSHGSTVDSAQKQAQEHKYEFLYRNKALIESELNQLFTVLKSQKKHQKEMWLFCYYCAAMLESYYHAYDDSAKEKEYKELKEELNYYFDELDVPKKKESNSFLELISTKINSDLSDILHMPAHLSVLRDKVRLFNVWRIYWTFCRLTVSNVLLAAKDTQWIDQLSQLVGRPINVDEIIKTIETPNAIFRGLSVGLFVVRFIMNSAMLLKHTFVYGEIEGSLSNRERFTGELWKRHAVFLNDVVWAIVNGLTNYAEFFHISAPVAGWATAGFLIFDVSLILWRRHVAEQDYLIKKSQYKMELEYYFNKLELLEEHDDQIRVLSQQLTENEIQWKSVSATFGFNATAAFLLAAGFSASMVLTPAIFVAGSYAVCLVGVSMYLSDDSYKNYVETSYRLENAQLEDKNIAEAQAEYQVARNKFLSVMLSKTLIPSFTIVAFAVCWEAALALSVMYFIYELGNSYYQHRSKHLEDNVFIEMESDEEDKLVHEYN